MKKVESVYEIVHPDGETETKTINRVGQDAATGMLQKAKDNVLKLKGFLIDGLFFKADLRDHFQRMADRSKQ